MNGLFVQNDGELIRVSDEMMWHLFTRDEAIELREELTEAIRMCPVAIDNECDDDGARMNTEAKDNDSITGGGTWPNAEVERPQKARKKRK